MHKSAGFTLLELIFTVSIASFLFGVAVPSFQALILNNRMVTQANTVLGSLILARSEALKRGRQVSVCASSDGSSCGNNWTNGWIVFLDIDGNGKFEPGDQIIRVYEALTGDSKLLGNGPVSQRITFNARGRSGAGTLMLCDHRGAEYGRGIVIAATGRSRISDIDDCGA
jgi:type IV fimbrial biogenesis protein FimT